MAQGPPERLKRLLIVGWDAADWKIADPLLAAGGMPHLARVIAGGVRGNLATIYPALSPMLWTSIATGKRPGKHGIHGFTEPAEDGLCVRPVSNLGRKTKAFWNILNQQGKRSIVVGWWPSHPAEPIRGAMVSDHFPFQTSDDPQRPLLPGCVWPAAEAAALAELRVHPTEISADILHMFAPDWTRVDQAKDKSVHDLAGIIAETMSVHAAATCLMERVDWDLAAIYFSGIDHFSHRFMRFHAGKGRAAKASDPQWFRDIVANAYRWHDAMLGRLMALAGEDCGVLVISDHGFHSDALLPDYIPAEAAGPAVEHRHFGVFCLRAPGTKRGERVYGASILDVAPTVLHLFDLPAGADMDGQVLINAFEDPRLPEPVPSWDDVPGEDGRHPASRLYDGASAAESMKQLVALGYIAPPPEDASRAVAETVRENRYNLARAYLDEGRPGPAAEILRALLAEDPEDARSYKHLFYCCLQSGDRAEAARVLESYDRACAAFAPRAAAELKRRREQSKDLEQGEPEPHDRREQHERQSLAEKAGGYVVERLLLRARLALWRANTRARKEKARAMLEELERHLEKNVQAALFLAEAFGVLGDYERALPYTRRVLRADPESAPALALAAQLYQASGRHEAAVARAIDSLALIYFQPPLHCLLGRSLAALGEWQRAEEAFRVALVQAPGLPLAHEELARLLRRYRTRWGEAALHLAQASAGRERLRKKRLPAALETVPEAAGMSGLQTELGPPPQDRSCIVTIVSGLPRSGTSMMMQMLAAGGIEPYTDGGRPADADNPRGYFEHQKATQLHHDSAWVPEARGRALKIVAHLLPYLRRDLEYRVVFMHRAVEEVVASQAAMLARLGRKGGDLAGREMARVFSGQLVRIQEWLKRAPNVRVLPMQYAEVIENPGGAAARLAAFLGEPFDRSRAAASVVPSLCHHRSPGAAPQAQ